MFVVLAMSIMSLIIEIFKHIVVLNVAARVLVNRYFFSHGRTPESTKLIVITIYLNYWYNLAKLLVQFG